MRLFVRFGQGTVQYRRSGQRGFRAGRGTADMIFAELARAKKLPLYVLFVDLMGYMTLCRARAYGRYSGLQESPNRYRAFMTESGQKLL